MKEINDIIHFFDENDFTNFPVLGFHFSEFENSFFLIIDKPKHPKGARVFYKISFKNVKDFSRKMGLNRMSFVNNTYNPEEQKVANIDLQDIAIKRNTNTKYYDLKLNMGISYGEIKFKFKEMFIEEIVATYIYDNEGRVISLEGDNKNEIDFYNPFNIDYKSLEE